MTSRDVHQRKVFISYAREDKAYAQSLAEFLNASGHQAWWDHLIHAGNIYREEIQKQIDTADKVIVLWTSHSVKSPWVIDEAQRANEAKKLVPVVMDVSQPPMGFGHLHAVTATDLKSEFPAILAAIEGQPEPGAQTIIRRQRSIILAAIAVLGIGLFAGTGHWFWQTLTMRDPTFGLNPEMDYHTYRSEKMQVSFVYPLAKLMVDNTHEAEGRLPLHTVNRETEVVVTRTPLPDHNNVRIGQRQERQALEAMGYNINYAGPTIEANWKDWYILSGRKPDGREFYYRRWYTSKDVLSIEFDYPLSKYSLYNELIAIMTQNNRFSFH
jgi:hypothetical protein